MGCWFELYPGLDTCTQGWCNCFGNNSKGELFQKRASVETEGGILTGIKILTFWGHGSAEGRLSPANQNFGQNYTRGVLLSITLNRS